MILSPKSCLTPRDPNCHSITINGNVISEVNEFVFLGLCLTNNLKWKTDVTFETNFVFV